MMSAQYLVKPHSIVGAQASIAHQIICTMLTPVLHLASVLKEYISSPDKARL